MQGVLLLSLSMFAFDGDMPHTVTLNNGLAMPRLAFAANVWQPDTCKNATALAIDAGFRFVWSSVLIGEDCQKAQRAALAAHPAVKRSDLFVAGTVDTQACSSRAACQSATMAGAQQQMDILGPEPLEMLMLDYPSSSGCDGIDGQWSALTSLYHDKKVKSIGVSNFGAAELECLFPKSRDAAAVVPPAANQLRVFVGHISETDLARNAAHGIIVQAYSPLGSGSITHDPLLAKIGAAHGGKSAAQVALRYLLQKNVTIATQ